MNTMTVSGHVYAIVHRNNRNLQVANSPSKLKFETNLSREDGQSTKHSQKPERISNREDSLSRKGLVE